MITQFIKGWMQPSEPEFKAQWVYVNTDAHNMQMVNGFPHFWCPERALWLSFDHMIQCTDGWYAKVIR